MIGPLTADLETALLRALLRTWQVLNATHLEGRLKTPAIALADGGTRLGQWVPASRTIEFSRRLVMEQPWGVVVEVLKHEVAHQFVTEALGVQESTPHGPVFREVCERLGFDARAYGLPAAPSSSGDDADRLLGRIAKLLALAESPNQHEAELAMANAQRLMLAHNLSTVGHKAYGFRHLGQSTGRRSEHERILAGILGKHFFVECIWVSVWRPAEGKRGSVLEVCGAPVNLDLAEYAHSFLLHTAARLWEQYRRASGLRGNRDRRAYLAGVMTGFADKLAAQRTRHAAEGLVWTGDGDLQRWWRRRHPHVRWTRETGAAPSAARGHGREAGRDIVLHRAVTATHCRGHLLTGR